MLSVSKGERSLHAHTCCLRPPNGVAQLQSLSSPPVPAHSALSLAGHAASWLQLLLPHTEAFHFGLLVRLSPCKKWLQLQGVQQTQPTLNQNPPRQDPDSRKTWGACSKKQVVMVRMSWDAEARSQLGMQSSNNCQYHHLSSCLQCQVNSYHI